jgi:hypothetical protein
VLALVVCAAPAFAQRAAGPFSGVLGAIADPDSRHTLDLRGSLFGSWDDTLTSSDATAIDPRFLRSGGSSGASGSLTHARRSSRIQWLSSAGSSMRLSGTESSARAAAFNGQTSLNADVSRGVSLSFSGSAAYSPYYSFAPGLDGRLSSVGAFGGGFGSATVAERNRTFAGGAAIDMKFSRRDSFQISGNGSRFEFLDNADNSVDSFGAQARFSHQLTRGLEFHAGFGRNEARYRGALEAPAASNSIDVGVGYGDTLSFSRRTSFSFASSTSALRWNDSTHYQLNGNATLSRAFGRSGSGSLGYVRATQFNAGFREPVQTDTVSGGFSNQLGRRASWSAQAGYVHGNIGFGSTSSNYNSYQAGGGLNIAVTRRLSMFTDYSFYQYDVPAGATTFTSLQKFSRQSVTAGLSVWAPLVADKRSTRDTR